MSSLIPGPTSFRSLQSQKCHPLESSKLIIMAVPSVSDLYLSGVIVEMGLPSEFNDTNLPGFCIASN